MSDNPLLIVDIHHSGYYGWGVWIDPDAPERWTAETVERLTEYPGYRMGINLGAHAYEESPVLAERIRTWLEMFPDRVYITGGDYAQLTACVRSDESNLRQILVGIETIEDTIGARPTIWTMSEPGNFSQLPQILHDLEYEGAILRIHGPGQGGSRTTTAEAGVVSWEGPDGTQIVAIPEYTGDRLSKQNDCTESMWMMTRYANDRAARGSYTLDDIWSWKLGMEARGISPVVMSKDDDHNNQPTSNNLCMNSGHLLAADTEEDDRFQWVTAEELFSELPEPTEVYTPSVELFETRKSSFCDYGFAGNTDWVVDLVADNKLRDAEFASLLAGELFRGEEDVERTLDYYVEPQNDSAWRLHLGAQNHDLSLKASLNLMYHLQYQSWRTADLAREQALRPVLDQLETGENGAVVVINPLGQVRREYATVKLPADSIEGMTLHDGEKPVPWEQIRREAELVIMGFVTDVPPLGYRVYKLVPGEVPTEAANVVQGLNISTDHYAVQFLANGGIESFVPAGDDRSVVMGGSLCIAGDVGGETVRSAGELHVAQTGPVSVVVEEEGRLGATHSYTIRYRIVPGVPYMLTELDIQPDFVDPATPGAAGDPSRKVELTARLGSHLRPAICLRRQPFTVAPYDNEIDPTFAAIHWCDYGTDEAGLAILNRGCVGQRWPEDGAEINTILWTGGNRGISWELALMPRKGDIHTADVHHAGEGYAAPMLCLYEQAHKGTLPDEYSVANISPDNVTVSAAFRRDGRPYVRVWEHTGQSAEVTFQRDGENVPAVPMTLELVPRAGDQVVRAKGIGTFQLL
jgi:hypothetical protein